MNSKFPALLLLWNAKKNKREMPWKGEKDPYKIWLSEIILQQTRVEQGLAYYQRFIQNFTDINKLANAKDEKVYKLWEGLGYYNRCKNLLETARYISKERKGQFPVTYEEILSLKGVGSYTAAAIASFAFNLPYAVVDGNVFRVLARVFGIKLPTDSTEGKKYFSNLTQEILDKKNPGIYNQALMDFGATVCKPKNPVCNQCIFKNDCYALKNNLIEKLPVKEKKIIIKKRWFNYLVMEYRGKTYINRRERNDIWKNLSEFALFETSVKTPAGEILRKAEKKGLLKKDSYQVISVSEELHQQLTHQKISGQFIKIKCTQPLEPGGFRPVSKKGLSRVAFPKLINNYLAGKQ